MPTGKPIETLGLRALNRAALARQMLLERADCDVVGAVERLAGIQTQAPNPPYFGLWSRLQAFGHAQLSREIVERRLVRIALMRGTLHLVSARDALAWRPLVQSVQERALHANRSRDLTGVDLDALAKAGRALVEAEPLSAADLGKRLAERWPKHEPATLSMAVRCLAPLVQVPPRGLWGGKGLAVHTTAEHWLGRPLDAKPSLEDMLRRYLAAFGPASVKDAQTWCGLKDLREAFEGMSRTLLRFRDEAGVELFDLPDAPRPDPDTPAPVRFLGDWDNLLLSYVDRRRIIADTHRHIYTANGQMPGTMLVDGFVHASWKLVQSRDAAALEIRLLAPLAKRARKPVIDEGRALLEFAAPGVAHEVRFIEAD
jgi:hypothetical protein